MKINLKKIGVATIAGGLLLAATAVVFSQQPQGPSPGPPPGFGFGGGLGGPGGPRGPGGPEGPPDGMGPFGRELNLTDEQKAEIKKINDAFRESTQSLHEQMGARHQGQTDPMSGEFNEAAFRTAAEARAKIQVELEVAHAKMMSQIAGILTAEQKAQLAARHQQMLRMGLPPPPPGPPIN